MTTVVDRVADIVAEQLGVDREEITSATPFVSDLGADSLDQARLVIELEKAFGIRFPKGAAERLQSIGDVVVLIEAAERV